MNNEEKIPSLSRRNFMQTAITAIGGVIASGFGIPGVGYIISPALLKRDKKWILLGSIGNIPINTPTLFKARVEQKTGWVTDYKEYAVYVITSDGKNYRALSNVCTHLGCHVRWIEDLQTFYCPCHNAVFDIDGQVLQGPPPRPLDEVVIKIEDEEIFMLGG